MDVLERLFSSPSRARLLRLFLMNPEAHFAPAEASRQAKVPPKQFMAEVRRLGGLGIIKSHSSRISVRPASKRGRKRPGSRMIRSRAFCANKDFPLFAELRTLILKSAPHAKGQLASKIKRLGNVKLAVLAGVFIDSPVSRADLLLVGEGMKKSRLAAFIRWLEAHIGRELQYVAMSTSEFRYRMDMYDRFLRDILELPHETVINKLGV